MTLLKVSVKRIFQEITRYDVVVVQGKTLKNTITLFFGEIYYERKNQGT